LNNLPPIFIMHLLRRSHVTCQNIFQNAHFGCAAFDLIRVMSACLSGRDRREHWKELLDEFYGYFKEECGNREMPYTLSQLKESYRQLFPLGGLMIIPMIGPLFDIVCKNCDEESNLELVVEKTEEPFLLLIHRSFHDIETR
uniref:Mono(ADP-ribosyl)transferase n=1 Tax=Angiostrongylus cantonensis TaxID=6313 RepID=A0A0K0D4S7_ANGCA